MNININWVEELENIIKENNLPVFDYFSEETREVFNRATSQDEILHYMFSFPFFKIRDLIYDIINRKEKLEDLPTLLKQKLKITTQQAEKIAKEIETRIFQTPNKETKIQEELKDQLKDDKIKKIEEKKEEKVFDPYREPID